MSLLGEDGRGFELARKLESLGVWRAWLGDSLYSSSNFAHALSSPSAWESFMRSDESRPKLQIHLQLRARALLFDKASISLFLPTTSTTSSAAATPAASSVAVSKLHPNYLQLHGDDVYFTLEDADKRRDGVTGGANAVPHSKSHSKSAFGVGSRYVESDMDNMHQRFRSEEFPETWYDQFIDKFKVSRPYRLSLGDRDSEKRSPEEMIAYLRILHKHKRRHIAFKQDQSIGYANSAIESASNMHYGAVLDASNSVDEEVSFFPETMFTWNCVPDSALPPIIRTEDNGQKEIRSVLDTLPQTKSQVMIERLGITVEHGGSLNRRSKKLLGQEQALQMSQKVVVRLLARVGFDSATEVPVEVFSQFMRCHIGKLGRILKVLSDSYRTECSAVELLKMFLQTAGYGNLGILMELVKDGSRTSVQPPQQQLYGVQPHLQSQQHTALRMPQQLQVPRQMHPQIQQMVHSQNLAFQQERIRRRQASTPRIGMEMDKERPMAQVKLENPDLPMDTNAFNLMHSRHPQMQLRQQQQQQHQQLVAISNLQAQSSNQLRQLTSSQITQVQTPNIGIVRPPPVKVEGFQELMGGDTNSKHDSEENKLTSPLSR